jgi:hypothetical protein
MSFVETVDNLALRKSELIERFECLIAPKADQEIEAMAQTSRSLTLQNFGRTMRLFAPLSLSKSPGIQGNGEFRYYLACSKGAFGAKILRRDLTKGEIR